MAEEYKILKNSRVSFDVVVDSGRMDHFVKIALKELGQNMSIGGFRKGKAPIDMIKNNIAEDKLLMETIDVAVKETYHEYVVKMKDKFLVLSVPKIDFKEKIDKDVLKKGFNYHVEVDIYPEFELPDTKSIKIKKSIIATTKKEVDDSILNLRKKRARLADEIGGKEVKIGDWVDIDFEVMVDGQKIADAGAKHFPLMLGNNSLIPGFEEQLLGLKKGETKKFSLIVNQNFHDKRLAGNEVLFDTKINEIRQVIVPELNDEFAKSLHIEKVGTVDDLEKFIKENIEKENIYRANEENKNKILEEIEKKTEFDVPDSLVDRELNIMWHEFEQNLINKNIDPNDYLKNEKLDKKNILDGWKEQAKKRSKYGLLIGELIKARDIKVTKKEVEQEIETELNLIKLDLQKKNTDWKNIFDEYQKKYKDEENKRYVEQKLIVNKLFETLLSEVI